MELKFCRICDIDDTVDQYIFDIIMQLFKDWKTIICQPEDIFKSKFKNGQIDWRDIRDADKLNDELVKDNPNIYVSPILFDGSGINYTFNRLRYEIENKSIFNRSPSYLAVVKKRSNQDYIVRAIFRASEHGIELAINPSFIELYEHDRAVWRYTNEALEQFKVREDSYGQNL